MPLGRAWFLAQGGPAALLVVGLLATSAGAAPPHTPLIALGFDIGPGWASTSNNGSAGSGGSGVVFVSRSWTRTFAYGIDARFWFQSRDTTRTELTVAGPSLTWQPLETGPLVRVMAGAGYEHHISELAASSTDAKLEGLGAGVTLGYDFRPWHSVGLAPVLDLGQVWLDRDGSAKFWGATVALTWYIATPPPS